MLSSYECLGGLQGLGLQGLRLQAMEPQTQHRRSPKSYRALGCLDFYGTVWGGTLSGASQ